MKFRTLILTNLIVILIIFFCDTVAAQMPQQGGGKGGGGKQPPGNKNQSSDSRNSTLRYITRHQFVLRKGIDSQYRNKTNLLSAGGGNRSAGQSLFNKKCARCHDEEERKNLYDLEYMDTPPPDLSRKVHLPVEMDVYLYWTISLGGGRFNTSMPRFEQFTKKMSSKQFLTEKEIWQVVLYVRKLQAESGNVSEALRLSAEDPLNGQKQRRQGHGFRDKSEFDRDDFAQPEPIH